MNSCTCASLQAKYNKSQAFITVYSRNHPYVPGVKFADLDPTTAGAYHACEVPYYFGTSYNLFRPTRNWTPWDRELSQKMTAALIAFATSGNPSTSELKWPTWTPQNEQYVNFGDKIVIEKVNRTPLDVMAKHRSAPGLRPIGPPRD